MQVIIDHGPYIVWISAADDFKDEDEEEVDEVEEELALYTFSNNIKSQSFIIVLIIGFSLVLVGYANFFFAFGRLDNSKCCISTK